MSFEGALPFLGIRNPTPAVALNRATEDGFYKPMWMLADSKLFGDIIGHYLYFWQGIFGPCGRWPHGHWR